MSNKEKKLHSQPTNLFVLKWFAPPLFALLGLAIFGRFVFTWRAIFILAFLVAGAFFISLAELELCNTVLRFRRLRAWTQIDVDRVVRSGIVWPGAIAFVQMDHFIAPWGVLFFVLDAPASINPLTKAEHPLLQFLGSGRRRVAQP